MENFIFCVVWKEDVLFLQLMALYKMQKKKKRKKNGYGNYFVNENKKVDSTI